MANVGHIAVSLDFEIGWGVWESERWRERERRGVYRDLRPALAQFTRFLGERQIALTWATVGAMIADPARGDFAYLPAAAQDHIARFMAQCEEQTRDGRDLFDTVAGCAHQQNFASHSFSHTRFDYPGMDSAARTEDLRRSRAAMAAAGAPVDRLVFPENIVADWPALSDAGIVKGRLPAPSTAGSRFSRVARELAGSPPLSRTRPAGDGVSAVTGSLFFNWYGRAAPLRRRLVNAQARRGLDAAIASGGILHLWLHPFNLVDTPGLAGDLSAFLDVCARRRDAGHLAFGGF